MSTPLVNTAFEFLQQLLQKEPDAKMQLLQMLNADLPTQKNEVRSGRQSLKQLAHKKYWNKQDWEQQKTVIPHNKLPKSLSNFLKFHIQTNVK